MGEYGESAATDAAPPWRDAVLIQRTLPHRDLPSEAFYAVLTLVGAPTVWSRTGRRVDHIEAVGAGDKAKLGTREVIVGTYEFSPKRHVDIARIKTPKRLPDISGVFSDSEKGQVTLRTFRRSLIAATQRALSNVAESVRGADDGSSTAEAASEPVVHSERWSGTVLATNGDSLWADLHNDDNGAEEEVELLRVDFPEASFENIAAGTSVAWTYDTWVDEDGSRITRSRAQVLDMPPEAPDTTKGKELAATWARLADPPK